MFGHWPIRPKFSRGQKKRIQAFTLYFEQDGKCFWCATKVFLKPNGSMWQFGEKWNAATFDHWYAWTDPRRERAISQGEQRLVLACQRCNQRRGDMPPERFAEIVKRVAA